MSIFIFAPEFSNGLNAERRFVSNVFKVVIVDAGFLKGCHIVHCRTGGAHDLKRNRAAAAFAESLAGVPFASTQVGNIKYKIAVKPGTALVVKGRIVLVRGNKKHIYISFFDGDKEVYRAKFIMQILQ